MRNSKDASPLQNENSDAKRITFSPDVPTDTRKEIKWVWVFAAVVLLITWLPYLIGYYRQGADWYFTGFVFGVEDGNSYIAKMLIGTSGDWLFRTTYTAYPQRGMLLFLPYILLGKLAAAPDLHVQLTALYGIFRLVAGFLAIVATYDFISVFISEVRWRRLALVLATLGGGFGWLRLAGFSNWFGWGLPLESYSPEAFGFLSIYGLPHLAMARAFLLWGLRDFLLLSQGGQVPSSAFSSPKKWLTTAARWIGLWLLQPIILVVGIALVGMFVAVTGLGQLWKQRQGQAADWVRWKRYFWQGAQIIAISTPLALYTFLAVKLDPILKTWEMQSFISSPPPLTYLLGYGVALPLALFGIHRFVKTGWLSVLPIGWVVMAPFMAYAPVSVQRRLTDGLWVALSILAVFWISTTGPRLRKLALAWLVQAFPMTLLLLTTGFLFVRTPSRPLFRPADEVSAFTYLLETAQPDDIVLAADDSANALPAWAPVHTLLGHGPESINGPALRPRVACFYSIGCSEDERQNLIAEFNIRYVLWGPGEKELGLWDPHASPRLKQVFASGDFIVFQTIARNQ